MEPQEKVFDWLYNQKWIAVKEGNIFWKRANAKAKN